MAGLGSIGPAVHEASMCEQRVILKLEEVIKVPAMGSVTT